MKPILLSALGLSLLSCQTLASPWIDSEATHLKHAIDLLVAEGVIQRPVNQYPLLWRGIINDLNKVDPALLTDSGQFAVQQLQHALMQAKRKRQSGIKALYNSEPEQTRAFGERHAQKAGIKTFGQITGDRVSAKVQVNYTKDALDQKTVNHHGSHLALLYDNWSVSIERLNYWWGPGNENALMLSNNSAPMKAVRLSRANTSYYGPSFFSWLGPWQISAIAAKQQPFSEHSGDLWGARFSNMPLPGLELGFSTIGSDFIHTEAIESKPGRKQRLTSFDLKYSQLWNKRPYSIYAEVAGENESGFIPSEPQLTLGIETFWGGPSERFKGYIEYTDSRTPCIKTTPDCGFSSASFIEKEQWIGATVGPNAKSYTVAFDALNSQGQGYGSKLKHTRFEAQAIDRTELEISYQQGLLNGLIKLSGRVWYDDTKVIEGQEDISSEVEAALKLSWEFRF